MTRRSSKNDICRYRRSLRKYRIYPHHDLFEQFMSKSKYEEKSMISYLKGSYASILKIKDDDWTWLKTLLLSFYIILIGRFAYQNGISNSNGISKKQMGGRRNNFIRFQQRLKKSAGRLSRGLGVVGSTTIWMLAF